MDAGVHDQGNRRPRCAARQPHADVICGFGGNDVIYGLGGDDILLGGAGDDRLFGGAGPDILVGGSGKDRLSGEAGTDRLLDVEKRDEVAGDSGDDQIEVLGGQFDRTVNMTPTYNLPSGTKVQWFYLSNSGYCLDEATHEHTDTVGTSPASWRLVTIPTYTYTDECFFHHSRGTWQVKITMPGNVERRGSVAIVSRTDGVDASTHDFSGIVAGGGEGESEPAPSGYVVALPVTLGPIG